MDPGVGVGVSRLTQSLGPEGPWDDWPCPGLLQLTFEAWGSGDLLPEEWKWGASSMERSFHPPGSSGQELARDGLHRKRCPLPGAIPGAGSNEAQSSRLHGKRQAEASARGSFPASLAERCGEAEARVRKREESGMQGLLGALPERLGGGQRYLAAHRVSPFPAPACSGQCGKSPAGQEVRRWGVATRLHRELTDRATWASVSPPVE